MAKQLLSDDIIEHIQDGYYATHEQDLSEDQVHELNAEQLHYYNKQGKAYRAAQKKKHRIIVGSLIALSVVVVAAVAILFVSMNSDSNLYDPNDPKDNATTEDTSTPGILAPPTSNTKAGAKDNAAQ